MVDAVRPRRLKNGDAVTIIATARKVSPEEMRPAIELLNSWGLEVLIEEGLYAKQNQFAGSDQHRIKMLQNAINNSKIKAIFCARGGYGTTRILNQIDFTPLLQAPKWIVGFSDITAMIAELHRLGIESIHGTMPILFNQKGNEQALSSLQLALFEKCPDYQVPTHEFNRMGQAKGRLIGGNLSIISHIMGSSSEIDTNRKILFIEDLDEYLYHIDRMMVQLKRAGKLSHLAGLIVGHMSDMNDNTIPFGKNALEIIAEHVHEFDYPVCFGFPTGHEAENVALPCSRVATLDVQTELSTLAFD